jgi:hypothetical protein
VNANDTAAVETAARDLAAGLYRTAAALEQSANLPRRRAKTRARWLAAAANIRADADYWQDVDPASIGPETAAVLLST